MCHLVKKVLPIQVSMPIIGFKRETLYLHEHNTYIIFFCYFLRRVGSTLTYVIIITFELQFNANLCSQMSNEEIFEKKRKILKV